MGSCAVLLVQSPWPGAPDPLGMGQGWSWGWAGFRGLSAVSRADPPRAGKGNSLLLSWLLLRVRLGSGVLSV